MLDPDGATPWLEVSVDPEKSATLDTCIAALQQMTAQSLYAGARPPDLRWGAWFMLYDGIEQFRVSPVGALSDPLYNIRSFGSLRRLTGGFPDRLQRTSALEHPLVVWLEMC
jgi:hypothetical protein